MRHLVWLLGVAVTGYVLWAWWSDRQPRLGSDDRPAAGDAGTPADPGSGQAADPRARRGLRHLRRLLAIVLALLFVSVLAYYLPAIPLL